MKKLIFLIGSCLPIVSTASSKSKNTGIETNSSQSFVEIEESKKALKKTQKKSYVDIVLAAVNLFLLLLHFSALVLFNVLTEDLTMLFPPIKDYLSIRTRIILPVIICILMIHYFASSYRFYKAYKNQNKQQAANKYLIVHVQN